MYVRYHILFSMPLLFTYIYLGPHSIIMYLSAVLVDVDHYIVYVLKKRNLSIIKAVKWYTVEEQPVIYLFHTIYFLTAYVLLNLVFPESRLLIYAMIGLIYHLTLDFIQYVLFFLGIQALTPGKRYTKEQTIRKAKLKFFALR